MNIGEKLLIVDDEVGMRISLQETLENDGYQVTGVNSGEAALDVIAEQTFDLALIDLRLRGMNGIELLKQLSQQAPNMTMIILTAHASLETAVDALRWGAHDYLFKPFKTPELRESIRTGLLKQQRNKRQQDLLKQLEHSLTRNLEEIRSTVIKKENATDTGTENRETNREAIRFLQRGNLLIDLARHVVTLDEKPLEFSPTEFDLLVCLTTEAPHVLAPQDLVRRVQGYESDLWEARDTVRYHVYRIRQKVESVTGRTDLIKTVRGVGYTIGEDFT